MPKTGEFWYAMIQPDDIVGIKTNVWGRLPTPEPLIQTIKRGVMGAGVPEEHIGIGDRDVQQQENFRNSTALINSRPMRTHSWSGVGSLIKNYIMFDNPSDYHDDACADLAKLWELPMVKGKTRLSGAPMICAREKSMLSALILPGRAATLCQATALISGEQSM